MLVQFRTTVARIKGLGGLLTVALSLKVNDGVVLAADSATSLMAVNQGRRGVANVYDHANKVFNLVKTLPIGVITWGAGSIGPASIATLVKDLRRRLAGDDPDHPDWTLQRDNYQLSDVAETFREYIYNELYEPEVRSWEPNQRPDLGFIIAGYSSHNGMAEEYQIDLGPDGCEGPRRLRELDESGVSWSGQPEAIARLLQGYGTGLPGLLKSSLGLDDDETKRVMEELAPRLGAPLIHPAMPMQDAIDLAEFLVYVSEMFARFMPSPPTVGGPIEVAAITKHEGFKWIARKHYFSTELNPGVPT